MGFSGDCLRIIIIIIKVTRNVPPLSLPGLHPFNARPPLHLIAPSNPHWDTIAGDRRSMPLGIRRGLPPRWYRGKRVTRLVPSRFGLYSWILSRCLFSSCQNKHAVANGSVSFDPINELDWKIMIYLYNQIFFDLAPVAHKLNRAMTGPARGLAWQVHFWLISIFRSPWDKKLIGSSFGWWQRGQNWRNHIVRRR